MKSQREGSDGSKVPGTAREYLDKGIVDVIGPWMAALPRLPRGEVSQDGPPISSTWGFASEPPIPAPEAGLR